jgi:hypothetical protein
LRTGCRGARNLQESRRIETKPRRKDQALGKREAIEAENEIDGKLGAATVTDFADVKARGKQCVEHRRGDLRRFDIAADQSDAIALPHLDTRAGHRNV